jgi:hypothetical protein
LFDFLFPPLDPWIVFNKTQVEYLATSFHWDMLARFQEVSAHEPEELLERACKPQGTAKP